MSEPAAERYTLIVDVEQRKVACVILHAVYGVPYDVRIIHDFEWFVRAESEHAARLWNARGVGEARQALAREEGERQ